MGTIDNTKKVKKWKQLSDVERYKIESFLIAGWSVSKIAEELKRDRRTISREISRGKVVERNSDWSDRVVYRAEHGSIKRRESSTNKGRPPMGISKELYNHVVQRLHNNYSPDAIIGELRRDGVLCMCSKTLYNYLYSGYFKGFLGYVKKKKRHKPSRKVGYHNATAKRIDERPEAANTRASGHWEMDTVVSGRGGKGALLVLTERHSRYELIFKLESCTQLEVVKMIDRLERRYKERFSSIFKSITSDNGSEFLKTKLIEKSLYSDEKRTNLYYAHPYSSWERGSNENANKLIRKWIKKGEDISNLPVAYIKRIQNWMNSYPRKIFNYKTASMICKCL